MEGEQIMFGRVLLVAGDGESHSNYGSSQRKITRKMDRLSFVSSNRINTIFIGSIVPKSGEVLQFTFTILTITY